MTASRKPTPPRSGKDADSRSDADVKTCPLCPRCEANITSEQLKAIFTAASDERIEAIKGAFNGAFEKFEVNTCQRKAHFFAQVRVEVGASGDSPAENMNYSEEGLKTQFKYFRDNPDEATLYGRNKEHSADQEAIANRAYGNRLGNGDVDSGDGWRYRGKGYIQLTGKSNYQAVQDEIEKRYPSSSVDIVESPEDILTEDGGMISAMAYWTRTGLNSKADSGAVDSDVDAITTVINRYTDSYAKRREYFQTAKEAFSVDECANKTATKS